MYIKCLPKAGISKHLWKYYHRRLANKTRLAGRLQRDGKKMARRAGRRAAGKATGRAFRGLFR
jgi:hypothetical protein